MWSIHVYLRILWCGSIVLLTIRYFDVAQLTTLTPIIITNFTQILSPECWFESLLFLLLQWNLLKIFSCGTSRIDQIHALVPHKSYPSSHNGQFTFYLSHLCQLGLYIWNIFSQIHIHILGTNNASIFLHQYLNQTQLFPPIIRLLECFLAKHYLHIFLICILQDLHEISSHAGYP